MKPAHLILKMALTALVDALIVAVAMFLAFLITLGNPVFGKEFWLWVLGNVAVTVFLFAVTKTYSVVYSSVGLTDIIKIAVSSAFICALDVFIALLRKDSPVSAGTMVVFGVILFDFTMISRMYKRIFTAGKFYIARQKEKKSAVNVMVIGAGAAASMIIQEMNSSDKITYKPVCILDDDSEKIGRYLMGVKIVGTPLEVETFVEKYDVKEIFIAMPSVDKKRVSEIIALANTTKCTVKTIPGTYQILNGKVSVSSLRKVEISDLLGREQASVDTEEIMGYIENKVVLVTGGGGSIGSELCRQIASHRPRQLIILDIYENTTYELEQELKRSHPGLNMLVLIASVRGSKKIEDVFKKYRPQIVFHAAAHKHVPLMETSPNEAVKNNVFGTLNVAKNADKYKAETFVLISTDKAVNPTNIMGATKRICEMIVQTIGKKSEHTKFVAVRFGNVLGSNGSVIPLFKKQIEEGGPITITDKNIIRYFMTIPEAVSLVLQAGAYAEKGQIFVLDMGAPVKIYDLAYNLIKLSGLTPYEDIDIVCTGLRPGEKLYEERLMDEEGLQTTKNGLISIAKPIDIDENLLWSTLDELYLKAYAETDEMKELVKALVPTYKIDKR